MLGIKDDTSLDDAFMPDNTGEPDEQIDESVETDESAENQEVTETPEPEAEAVEPAAENPEPKTLPFHEHPKWKRMNSENQELKGQLDNVLAELQELRSVKQHAQETGTVPPELQSVFGDNVEAMKAMTQYAEKIAEQKYLEKQQEIEKQQMSKEQQVQQFRDWADERFAELSEKAGEDLTSAESTLRNQILDLCETYGIVDVNQMPDFEKAYELHQKLSASSNDKSAVREIAAKTNAKSVTVAPAADEVMTASKLRKQSLADFLN